MAEISEEFGIDMAFVGSVAISTVAYGFFAPYKKPLNSITSFVGPRQPSVANEEFDDVTAIRLSTVFGTLSTRMWQFSSSPYPPAEFISFFFFHNRSSFLQNPIPFPHHFNTIYVHIVLFNSILVCKFRTSFESNSARVWGSLFNEWLHSGLIRSLDFGPMIRDDETR